MRNLCAWPKDVSCLRLCSSKCLIKQMCHVCENQLCYSKIIVFKGACAALNLVIQELVQCFVPAQWLFQRMDLRFPFVTLQSFEQVEFIPHQNQKCLCGSFVLGLLSMQLVFTLLLSVNDCPYSKWLREIHLLYLPIMLTIIVPLGLSAYCAKVLLFGFYWDLMNITSKFFPFQRSSMKSRYPFWIENSRGWLMN